MLRNLFLDFETFYGHVESGEFTARGKPKMFNLSLKNPKLSYTDYVRHPEFEVLGVSLRHDNDDSARFVRSHDIPVVFAEIDWDSTRVIAHNAIFDGLVMHEVYGIVPREYFCTLAAAEAIWQGAFPVGLDDLSVTLSLGKKSPDLEKYIKGKHVRDLDEPTWKILADYANNDTELLYKLYQIVENALPGDEQRLMDLTLKLFTDPVLRIDVPLAQEALQDAINERDSLVSATGFTREEISGNNSFERILKERLGWVPQKVNSKGEIKPAFAKTDLEFVTLKSHPDEQVRRLVEARQEVKSSLGITRAERLVRMGTTGSRSCNICLHYGRAHTLRWTGGNKMNFQNFPRGSKLRQAILAPEGHQLCVVDSSQIEARWLAAIAGQDDLVEIFRTGKDPYAIQASKVYGYEVIKADHPVERFMGKTMVLGLGYGMGWRKFYNEIRTGARGMALDIELDFAKRAVDVYRSSNPAIMRFHKTAEEWLWYMVDERNPPREEFNGLITLDPKNKKVIFPNGCYLRYPLLSSDDGDLMYKAYNSKTKRYEWNKIYGGKFVENLVQALARHTVASQILRIADRYRTVLFVHDECVYCVPTAEADEAMEFGITEFRRHPGWLAGLLDVPLDSEGGYDVCYSK